MSKEWTVARAFDILDAAHEELEPEARELAGKAMAFIRTRLPAAEPADTGRDAHELLRRAWRILSIDAPNDKTTDDIEAFLTRPPSEAAALGAMLDQALTDPENQPSQWGTIPLSMLPARRDTSIVWGIEPDYDDGVDSGWNACLDAIAALNSQPARSQG